MIMVSQPIWIAVVVVALFIGIGASYTHFANTYDPMSMKFHNQELFDQMMSHNPKMSQHWMDSDMMNAIMNDPEMQKMIMTTMTDSNQMQMMEDMMADMMERMKTDPVLEQAMIEHMDQMKASRDAMMNTDSMMDTRTSDGQHFVEEIKMQEIEGVFLESMKYTENAPIIDDEKGYFVDEIADGIYWLIGSGYQVMFLTTGEGVIVIDAPQPIGEKYLQAIQEVTDEPITHMIYSHSHADHTGAAGQIFPSDIEYIAHQDTADILVSENDPNRPIPTITFDDTYTLSVGNQVLELSYIGAFHSEGDMIILAPKQKVVMAVDLFHPGAAPYKAFGVTVNLDTHIEAHDTLVNDFDFDVLISGHEQILGTKHHIKIDKEFVLSMMEITTQAIAMVSSDEVIQRCVDDTMEQWQGKLHNLEQYMVEHCTAMREYVSSQ